jgi:hypothetical protein
VIPGFDGAICFLERKEALWEKFVTGGPRSRMPSEQQYSDPLPGRVSQRDVPKGASLNRGAEPVIHQQINLDLLQGTSQSPGSSVPALIG